MMNNLYHYTSKQALKSIKEKGLLNVFGLIFFTTEETTEPSVDFRGMIEQGRVSVELTDEFEKVSDLLETNYELLCQYFNPELIHVTGADINNWYVICRDVKTEEILNYEAEGEQGYEPVRL